MRFPEQEVEHQVGRFPKMYVDEVEHDDPILLTLLESIRACFSVDKSLGGGDAG